MDTALLSKYDTAAPRYTSYPTVPYWSDEKPEQDRWLDHVGTALAADEQISLYIHLPFCERLCTYCGCNKHITLNHAVEQPYIEAVLKEWRIYRSALGKPPVLRELHLGGGTPTFFHPDNLRRLLEPILADVTMPKKADFSFEAHPTSTSKAHLEALYKFGFRRVSIGVQDFDEELLEIVNRHQTPEEVERCTDNARDTGYTSINYDLIFGLPRQTPDHIHYTADQLEIQRPDRIAFYSYAHVPWFKRSQCAYSEADIPTGAAKRLLYEQGRGRLEAMGYAEIGMDHFALPDDSLYKAMRAGTLHRNFMGYTPYATRLMIGLGASAIGDSWTAYAQNEKTIADYQSVVATGRLPLFRGHLLDSEDERLRRHILRLMTSYQTGWTEQEGKDALRDAILERLLPLAADGLVQLTPFGVRVTETGRSFLRNICMAFDAHYWRKQPEGKLFSQAV